MKRLLTYLAVLPLFYSCDKDNFGDCDCSNPTVYPNTEISEIIDRYAGNYRIVNEDLIVAGYVTANDISGNFYRTFIVDDGTGALEVRAGLYDLKNLFPEGRYVAIRAKGLVVSKYNGVMQIGYSMAGGSLPEYFGHAQVLDKYVFRGQEIEETEPISTDVSQLNEDLCGRLVTVAGLTLKEGEETIWASQDEYSSYSNRVFTDRLANEVMVVTSKYADYAGNTVPGGLISVTGILTKINNNTFGIKMRRITDVEKE